MPYTVLDNLYFVVCFRNTNFCSFDTLCTMNFNYVHSVFCWCQSTNTKLFRNQDLKVLLELQLKETLQTSVPSCNDYCSLLSSMTRALVLLQGTVVFLPVWKCAFTFFAQVWLFTPPLLKRLQSYPFCCIPGYQRREVTGLHHYPSVYMYSRARYVTPPLIFLTSL